MSGLQDSFNLTTGLLLPGAHSATWNDVEKLFVTSAPHRNHRKKLLNEAKNWVKQLRQETSIVHIWLDGGFITHKDQAPSDIDIVALLDTPEFTSTDPERLKKFRTVRNPYDEIVKPPEFKGLVDGYIVEYNLKNIETWLSTWGSVKNPLTGQIVPGLNKGFIEVAE